MKHKEIRECKYKEEVALWWMSQGPVTDKHLCTKDYYSMYFINNPRRTKRTPKNEVNGTAIPRVTTMGHHYSCSSSIMSINGQEPSPEEDCPALAVLTGLSAPLLHFSPPRPSSSSHRDVIRYQPSSGWGSGVWALYFLGHILGALHLTPLNLVLT